MTTTFGHMMRPAARPAGRRTFQAAAGRASKIPDTYDQIFSRVSMGIPIQLLKATAWNESRFDPKAQPKDREGKVIGSARGLGQIIRSTLKTFNQANGYSFSEDDMFDPEKNAMVIAWLYKFIADLFAKETHVFKQQDWDDPNYVGAVLLAYGAGSGDKHGVVNIIRAMEKAGIPKSKMTPEGIREMAMTLFPSLQIYNDGRGYMSDPALLKNINAKLRDYFELRGQAVHPSTPSPAMPITLGPSKLTAPKIEAGTVWKVLGVLGGGLLLLKLIVPSRKVEPIIVTRTVIPREFAS